MTIIFKARLKAGIKYDEDAKVYITYSPALGIYSQGENAIQAKLALEDAVESFFSVAYKKGVLERLLKNVEFSSKDEFVSVEEKILEKNHFQDIFDFRAYLPLVASVA